MEFLALRKHKQKIESIDFNGEKAAVAIVGDDAHIVPGCVDRAAHQKRTDPAR